MIYLQGNNGETDIENRLMDMGRGEDEMYGESNMEIYIAAKWLQSCLTLCDPIYGNLPGSPIPEILQARTLDWVAISFSSA